MYLSIKTDAIASLIGRDFLIKRTFTKSPPIIPGRNVLKKQPIMYKEKRRDLEIVVGGW
ncbi:hypothetical protein JCM13991_16460 [Thermodesulfovibrio hydrogeniphilus]